MAKSGKRKCKVRLEAQKKLVNCNVQANKNSSNIHASIFFRSLSYVNVAFDVKNERDCRPVNEQEISAKAFIS